MKRVLITQHHPHEGPGTIGDFLSQQGAELVTVQLQAGQLLPSLEGFDAVVSMGGPMNVYEEEKHPWLADETELLARAARQGMPVLGICLGAQLLAKALGARVVDSPVKEIGWRPVHLTPEGKEDPLFQGVADSFDVLQWHGDMFQIPEGARLLARGDDCPHQAFVFNKAYGLQFHVEVTPEILRNWYENQEQAAEIEAGWQTSGKEMAAQAPHIYRNFWKLMD